MGQHPLPFPTLGSPEQVQVSFTDFSTGKGVITLYPIVTASSFELRSQTAYNHAGDETITGTSSNGNIIATGGSNTEIDFDIEFKRAAQVSGRASISFTAVLRRISGGSGSLSSTYTATLIHYDGSTETSMGTDNVVITETLADGAAASQVALFSLDVAGQHFNKGDILRLTLKATNDSATWDSWILIDSKNREISIGDFTSTFSICTVEVPIRTQS